MRTYSHALLTLAAWLWVRRRRYSRQDFSTGVCGRNVFRKPDAALHPLRFTRLLIVAAALALYAVPGAKRAGLQTTALSFLLGRSRRDRRANP